MKKKILIIHGWDDNGTSYWIPWLKKQLEKRDFVVYNPDFPNPKYPQLSEWVKTARNTVGKFDNQTIIIAYSSGFTFSLQLLSQLKLAEKIDKLIGLAPFDRPLDMGGNETEDLYKPPINYNNIQNKADSFYLIASDNDPYIPLKIPRRIQKELNAQLQVIKGGGLLNYKSGYNHPYEILNIIDEKSS